MELDPSPWEPNMNAVRAAIRYAMATERLLAEEQAPPYPQISPYKSSARPTTGPALAAEHGTPNT